MPCWSFILRCRTRAPQRTVDDTAVGEEPGAAGADLGQGPHLSYGRVMPEQQNDGAGAVHLGAFVRGAPVLTAGAGGVGPYGGGSGVSGCMGFGEPA